MTEKEMLELLVNEVGKINGRLDGMDSRLDGIDSRLDGIDSRLDGMDGRFDTLESKIDELATETELISRTVNRIEVNFKNHTHEIGKTEVLKEA
ncbi:hypothetical protein MWH25_01185 [Natroniella acetigena]|uniref:hypothetical protein n=1 Tax=Natroniella acetigena TaxID=52004 RepID=UPI00200A3200|nr:hypothetical protein [Natroniella acetigena]MCK8826360.1 hypothetical protein [Natroniella acetigena]